jgi:Fic family protein
MLFQCPQLTSPELRVVGRIEALKEQLRWQLNAPHRWTGSLRRLSIARAIQGSNSIEGYDAKLDDAAAVAIGEEPLDADTETTLALQGYRNAMTYVLQLATDTRFEYSTQLVKSLHFMMTSYDLKARPGLWRAGSVFVQREEDGEIVHEGAPLELVDGLMQELADGLNVDSTETIVRAAMAHLNLVMIHPFRDGNGRMARCMQSLVLARDGVLAPVFMSIEEYLGRNTPEYYQVLAAVGGGTWSPERDALPWVRFCLKAHLRQAMTVQRRVRESERLWMELERIVARNGLADRTTELLYDAAMGLRVRNATYRAIFEQAGEPIAEQTASRDLRLAVEAGLLIAHGERRGRFYVAAGELRDLRMQVRRVLGARDDTDPFEESS